MEINILRQNYATKAPAEILQLLPTKTPSAISHKSQRLGLVKKDYFWTLDELNTLKEIYSHMSKRELLKTLEKNWTSIRHKAFELGLVKAPHMRYSANWKNHGIVPILLTEFQKGYITAIIDGEGSICIVKASDKRQVRHHIYLAPLISIVNTDPKLMAGVRDMLKVGRFYKEPRRIAYYKDKYVYTVASINGCKQILEQIKNTLIVKKRQAEFVLQLIAIKEKKTTGVVTPEEIKLYEEVKRLNVRGNGEQLISGIEW